MNKLQETISLVKILHKNSILNDDPYYTDKLLEVIINLSSIDEDLLTNNHSNKVQDEIAKVKRKVPKWMKKKHQYNYRILETYMDFSLHNQISISVEELEVHSGLDKDYFLGHYNSMKTISKNNHSKVFEEVNDEVRLWKPISSFIEDLFKEEIVDFIYRRFDFLLNYDFLPDEIFIKLQNAEYSKKNFHIDLPLLVDSSDNKNSKIDYTKYYEIPMGSYFIYSNWDKVSKHFLLEWLLWLSMSRYQLENINYEE
jgi:uncharacterized protein YbcC (UPF0753/DUF2309 family)